MRKKRKTEESGFNVWRSYSDMMAGILLLFVLIMCVTLFQAQKNYNDSIQERDEKIQLQEEYTAELLLQQKALEEQAGQLKTQDEQLKTQDEKLSEQEMLLAEMAAQLKEQEEKLNLQEATLNKQQEDIDEKTTLLSEQQKKIDNIIGVKAEVVSSLQREFAANNVNVNIDSQTGAMLLDANVMFDVNEAELTEEGKEALRTVLPTYCKVLLQEKNKEYLAEIIIAGYTDTDGDYSYNMELSQQRSLAVAQYLLEIQHEFLDEKQMHDLEQYLSVNGNSEASPILDENGKVDKDASRRVEVKFRLKDEQMISELNQAITIATGDTAE